MQDIGPAWRPPWHTSMCDGMARLPPFATVAPRWWCCRGWAAIRAGGRRAMPWPYRSRRLYRQTLILNF